MVFFHLSCACFTLLDLQYLSYYYDLFMSLVISDEDLYNEVLTIYYSPLTIPALSIIIERSREMRLGQPALPVM